MELIEKDNSFLVLNTVRLCLSLKISFQTNDPIAGFDGLNMFSQWSWVN
jgi:hypothetical protein